MTIPYIPSHTRTRTHTHTHTYAHNLTSPLLLYTCLLPQHNKHTNEYSAVAVNTAHEALSNRWNSAYEAISKPPVLKQLPLYSLLPGGEDELLQVSFGKSWHDPGRDLFTAHKSEHHEHANR
jgi:hypothetical protein